MACLFAYATPIGGRQRPMLTERHSGRPLGASGVSSARDGVLYGLGGHDRLAGSRVQMGLGHRVVSAVLGRLVARSDRHLGLLVHDGQQN